MVQRFGSIVTSEIISTYCSHFINSSPREILPHFIKEKMLSLHVPLKKLKYNKLRVLTSVCLLKKRRQKRK